MIILDELNKILTKYRTNPFLFIKPNCPNTNNGDELIYLGMKKVLKSLNIRFAEVDFINNGGMPCYDLPLVLFVTAFSKGLQKTKETLNDSSIAIEKLEKKIHWWTMRTYRAASPDIVILIGGGANINDLYGHGTKLLKVAIEQNPNNVIIVAPQTYWFKSTQFPEIFKNSKQKIYLFCREKISYFILKNMKFPPNVSVHLSQDTSLYLTREDLLPFANQSIDCCYDLLCLRTDKESAVSKKAIIEMIKKNSNGKRKLFSGDICYLFDFSHFIGLVEGAQTVYTDRLHVAVLGSILGKPTVLFPNSYYKSKAVFEYGLSNHVRFVTEGLKDLGSKSGEKRLPVRN